MTCRLAIFDFDGTLADSFPFFTSTFNGLAEQYGFRSVAPDELPALRRMHPSAIMRHVEMPRWKLPLVTAQFLRLMHRHRADVPLFDGIPEALSALAAKGVRLAVVSSNDLGIVRDVMSPAVARHIDHFACGTSIFGKRRHIRTVLKRSGVDPAHAMYVGDQMTDLEAAHASGVTFGAVTWGYADVQVLAEAGADEVFETVPDLLRLGDPR